MIMRSISLLIHAAVFIPLFNRVCCSNENLNLRPRRVEGALMPRQQPANQPASDFYRRAYQACESMFSPYQLQLSIIDADIAAVAKNWLYIDGGSFAYSSDDSIHYDFGTRRCPSRPAAELTYPQHHLFSPLTCPKIGPTHQSLSSHLPSSMAYLILTLVAYGTMKHIMSSTPD